MANVYPLCVSGASIQVQILPHYGEISVGASKFFVCEGETAPLPLTLRLAEVM